MIVGIQRWLTAGVLGVVLLLAGVVSPARAQFGADAPSPEKLVHVTVSPAKVAPGGEGQIVVHVTLEPGWHVNANPPALEYNIPTTVEFDHDLGITFASPRYPAGEKEKFEFDETPMLVYTNSVDFQVGFVANTSARSGTHTGTLKFQACNNQICLQPASITFPVTIEVVGAPVTQDGTPSDSSVAATAAPDTTSATGAFSTSAPTGGTASAQKKSQLEEALAKGGLGWFLALFVGGLLLNLTPCVFPMLGVTVSIFGARAKEPLPKVFTTAVLYVLGICVTYTALGVVAALTGGLFGSALQSVWVNVVLGGLMLVLSLGMFGVYEMQPPLWLMDKLGGAQATNFAGAFLSGLGVGVIAAPCVGPFVVAVLALVAQKGSVAFGVQTMFTLSLGLGFPYLFLATFSNLLQALPRSGDWMIWVKHAFGVIMASIGLYYLAIGFAADYAPYVLPVALAVGGLWLGFIDHSAGKKPGAFKTFTRIAGGVALFAGVVMGTQMYLAAARTLTWKVYSPEAVAASVAAGRPVMMDFSADWCVPCHELELNTFSDPAVVSEARKFDRYKVDLTKYDAPESEKSRKQYGITGVPTVVFLGADGQEIADARVEGFMPPQPFIGQMRRGAMR